ncbi:hypothetical protein BDQ17DRAFT_1334189 [Cyathus striatus]|nr:hypothetical protein BDQ17DRAFT_1334189 [Cyathus striatus]
MSDSQAPITTETIPQVLPRPDYTRLALTRDDVFTPGPCPSEVWLKNPGWIDGTRDPPGFYHSHQEIEDTLSSRPQLPPCSQAPPPSYLSGVPSITTSDNNDDDIAILAVSDPAGIDAISHQVTATIVYISVKKANPATRSRSTAKKFKSLKFGYINLNGIDCCKFVNEFLKLHDLAGDYSPGIHNDPSFKLSWTGSAYVKVFGGKSGAITINTDINFNLALCSLLKKNKSKCHIMVEFDIDSMNGFCITNKRALTFDDNKDDAELSYGTKVPQLDGYTAHELLQGKIVLELKKKWACEQHQGEHGSHLGLNHHKLSLWAAAIAAQDATKHEPPNTVDFDGLRDGRAVENSSNDMMGLAMAAIMPILASLVPKPTPTDPPTTPIRHNRPSTSRMPSHHAHLLPPFSLIPSKTGEVHACLNDFFNVKGIDLWHQESLMVDVEFTPENIPSILPL